MALSKYNLHCKTSCIDIMIWLMCGQAKMDNDLLIDFQLHLRRLGRLGRGPRGAELWGKIRFSTLPHATH